MQTRQYAEERADFPNPERGFYRSAATSAFSASTRRRFSVVHVYFRLDQFKSAPISASYLRGVQDTFDRARSGGLKVIPRFTYNFPTGLPLRRGDEDSSLAQVLGHIGQIQPVLRANSDVIAFVEAGFIGAWGEWHHSTNGLDTAEAKSTILRRLLQALPSDRFVAIRYQQDKSALFGRTAPAMLDEILTGDDFGRVAHHNDCLFASADDFGTYRPNDAHAVEKQKAYLAAENEHMPQGGETCSAGPEAERYIHCGNAQRELGRLHWSVLNADYHLGVYKVWRAEGCYAEIARRLGYRLRLVRASFPRTLRRGGTITGSITIANDGFAAPYNRRGLELILREVATGRTTALNLPGDPRRWSSGKEHQLRLVVQLPRTVGPGRYELLLNLPDPAPTLHSRPPYSIRLANRAGWEAASGYNRLLMILAIER